MDSTTSNTTTTTTPLSDNNDRGFDVCGIYRTPYHPREEHEQWPKIEEDSQRGTLILHYPNGVKKHYARVPRIHRAPAFPDYVSCSARLESFRKLSWPKNHPLKPEALADAGFFYRGKGDETHCFYCSAGLREWTKDDDPWVEHAKHLPDCSFLVMVKGEDFVQSCQAMKNVQVVQPRAESLPENSPENLLDTTPPPEEVNQQQQLHQQQQQQEQQQQQQTVNSCERKPDHSRTPNTNAVQQVSSQQSIEDSPSSPSPPPTPDVEQPENLVASPTSIASSLPPSPPESAPASPSPSEEVASTSSSSSSSSDESLDPPETPSPSTTSTEKTSSDKLEEKSEESKKIEQLSSPSPPPCHKSTNHCLICLIEDVKLLFIPCGHAVTCVRCGHAVDDCIVCRRPIAALNKLHLP